MVKASSVLVSVLVGIAVTVAAGLIPALRASRVAPLEAMREAAADPASPSPRRGIVGAVLAVAGLAVTLAGTAASGSGALSIVGLGALLLAIGVIVLGPVVARAVTGAVGLPVARWRGMPGSLARGNAMRNPRRSAAAATALMVGVTVVALFTVFAASLTAAVTNDVTDSFTGDIAVTAGSLGGGGSGGGISPEVTSAVAGVQGVRLATGLTSGQARVAGQAENVTVVDPAQIGQVLNLHSSAGSVSALGADQLGVSKRQADSKHWQLGTTVPVVLPDGTASQLIVGAIYTSRDIVGDYVMPIALWTPHAIQSVDSAIFVKLAPGTSVAVAEAAVSRVTAAYGKLTVADHAAYVKSASSGVGLLAGLVNVLLVLAIIIAVLGIANTISLSVYERTREIGLLRAVGETRRQLRSMIRLESLIVSLFGTVGGLALGAFLGWALVEGASKSSGIGTFSAPVTELVVVLVLGGIAGVIAAIRPARRAARLPVLAAIAAE